MRGKESGTLQRVTRTVNTYMTYIEEREREEREREREREREGGGWESGQTEKREECQRISENEKEKQFKGEEKKKVLLEETRRHHLTELYSMPVSHIDVSQVSQIVSVPLVSSLQETLLYRKRYERNGNKRWSCLQFGN